MQPRLPKIAAMVVERPRFDGWLATHSACAVRYVVAPAGCGKTTAAVLYARQRGERCAYVTLASGCEERDVIAAFAAALALPVVGSYPQLIAALAERPPLEIVVDHADRAGAGGLALLERIFTDVPDGISFIYLARNGEALPLRYARAQGLVEIADGTLLAFDDADVVRLQRLLGVDATADEVARLLDATHGWAIAVAGTLRVAAALHERPDDALRAWRGDNDATIADLIAASLTNVDVTTATRFGHVVAGHLVPDEPLLRAFYAQGLFVTRAAGRFAINPLVRPSVMRPADDRVLPAVIEMFGRFEMTVGGRPVEWIRRRDRQIVQYLAAQRDRRATRAQLLAVFWPDADRQLAGQSLRSACSTIRRAIGACVGPENVERYFIGNQTLELVGDNVVISSAHFLALYAEGQAAAACGKTAEAFMAFRSAEMLYRSPFLAGEEPAPWSAPYERSFGELVLAIGESLEALAHELDAHVPGGGRSERDAIIA